MEVVFWALVICWIAGLFEWILEMLTNLIEDWRRFNRELEKPIRFPFQEKVYIEEQLMQPNLDFCLWTDRNRQLRGVRWKGRSMFPF